MNGWWLSLIFAGCVTLATQFSPTFEKLRANTGDSSSPLQALVGGSRKLFSNQLFTMADVYFHSGYYPSIFDQKKSEGPSHLDVAVQEESTGGKKEDDDESFLGKSKDSIDAFGRNFFPTVHSHLSGSHAREILPWLKLSAEMDPKRIDTYVTASYWLRTALNQPKEAEEFLREGLRENPQSPDILLELGRIYLYSKNDPQMAHNILDLGVRRWNEQFAIQKDSDTALLEELRGEMVRADEKINDLPLLLKDLEDLDKSGQAKPTVEKYITEVKTRLKQNSTNAAPPLK